VCIHCSHCRNRYCKIKWKYVGHSKCVLPGCGGVRFSLFLQWGDRVKTDTETEREGQVMKEKENESDYGNKAFELTADEKKLELIQS